MRSLMIVVPLLLTACGLHDAVHVDEDLDQLVSDELAENDFLGLGVGVRTADRWPCFAADGNSDPWADHEYDVDATEQVIGSVTKLYTATLVMQLVEDDRIGLDDPVDRWISFPGAAEITVRMLLSHTSGLSDYLRLLGLEQLGQPWMPRQLLDIALAAGPMGAPGMDKAIYSNTNFLVLALIVEEETGMAWEQNIQERIAGPLGLDHTYFAGEQDRAMHLAGGWIPTEAGWLDVLTLIDPSVGWAVGGMVTTNVELLVFTAALFDGELFDSPTTLARMLEFDTQIDPAYQDPREPPSSVGLGIMRMTADGITLDGHLGHIDGYNAGALRDPVTGEIIVVTSNDDRAFAGPIALRVARTLRAR